jgi:cytochrome c oxidase cbb3-type subunit 3
MPSATVLASAAALIGIAALTGCRRETRRLTEQPPGASPAAMVTVGALQPGPAMISDHHDTPYRNEAYAVSQGQQLFSSMNCVGCHSHGGGGMGPALMDSLWIYGSAPDQIFASIAQGRPNGMPAWKYTLDNQQIWQLVAYVRSLSGLDPKGARSGRPDAMEVKVPEFQTGPQAPRTTTPGVMH